MRWTLEELLHRAVDLATASVGDGGGPFGAVVVRPAPPSAARQETRRVARPEVRPVARAAASPATRSASAAGSWEVVAEGTNRVVPQHDPTAHAEVVALRRAGAALGSFDLSGCVLVASCEPCPMCLTAGLWARLDAMHFAADRYDAAAAGFDDLAFYEAFDTPRERWAVAVRHRPVAGASQPFDTWRAARERVAY